MKLNEQIAEWWLRNARIKHGHPPGSDSVTIPTQPEGMSTAAKVGLGLIAGAGALMGAERLGWLPTGSATTETAATPPATTADADSSASLYQYLEDTGFHLPAK